LTTGLRKAGKLEFLEYHYQLEQATVQAYSSKACTRCLFLLARNLLKLLEKVIQIILLDWVWKKYSQRSIKETANCQAFRAAVLDTLYFQSDKIKGEFLNILLQISKNICVDVPVVFSVKNTHFS